MLHLWECALPPSSRQITKTGPPITNLGCCALALYFRRTLQLCPVQHEPLHNATCTFAPCNLRFGISALCTRAPLHPYLDRYSSRLNVQDGPFFPPPSPGPRSSLRSLASWCFFTACSARAAARKLCWVVMAACRRLTRGYRPNFVWCLGCGAQTACSRATPRFDPYTPCLRTGSRHYGRREEPPAVWSNRQP